MNDLAKDVTQLMSKSEGPVSPQSSRRKGGWGRRRPSWCGPVWGRGREGPPTRPARQTVRSQTLPAPTPSLPPKRSSFPVAWLLGGDSGQLVRLSSMPPASWRLNDESLLPPWGQAREGMEGGLGSGFRGQGPSGPAGPLPTGRGFQGQWTDPFHWRGSQEGRIPVPFLH